MIGLLEAAAKLSRPGVLGAKGAKLERQCARELKAYFSSIAPAVEECAKYADYSLEAALMAVDAKMHNVLRTSGLREILASNLEAAWMLGWKQDLGIAEEADDFQEWPDSTGYDDHGRGPGGFNKSPIKMASKLGHARTAAGAVNFAVGYKSEKELKLGDIRTAQPTVNSARVSEYVKNPKRVADVAKGRAGNELLVTKYKGEYVIVDGNHRVAAAMERGDKTIKVQVVDMDSAFADAKAHQKPGEGILLAMSKAKARKAGIKEADDFQEWPDSTGYDDHGRGENVTRVYHGTTKYFDAFDLSKKTSWSGGHEVEFIGPSLTNDRAIAKSYPASRRAGDEHHTLEVDLKMSNPKKYRNLSAVKNDLAKTLGPIKDYRVTERVKVYRERAEAFKAHLKAQGYDGIAFGEGKSFDVKAPGVTYIPFDVEQAKIVKRKTVKVKEADPLDLGKLDKLGPTGQAAAEYAKKKSAELVTAIDETTRAQIRKAVSDGITGRLGVPGTGRSIRELLDTWDTSRADMIASTEMNDSISEAQIEKMRALSVKYKQIILSDDACEICRENSNADPLPVEALYPSGDLRSPFHPNCRCATTGARAPEDAAA